MKSKNCWLLRLMPLFSVVVFLGAFLGATQTASGNPVTLVISVNGVERSALVYPAINADVTPSPVVMVFHGWSGTSQGMANYTHFHEEWPEATVVYPQGLKDIMSGGGEVHYGWQRYPGDRGNRDVYFVEALIDELFNQYGIDSQRVYATGYSNGGFLTYALLVARPLSIAKFAPVASYMAFRPFSYMPRPVLYIFGESDHAFDYDGDCPNGGLACAMSTLDWLLAHNQTSDQPQEWFDTGYQIYPAETASGAPVIWNLNEGGHIWPSDATANIVRFFSDVIDFEIVGPAQVTKNSSVPYSAMVYFENNSTCEVTDFANWSIDPNPNASISPDGALTLSDVEVGQTINISCEYIVGDVTVSAEKLVTVVEGEGTIPIAHWKFDEGSGAIAYDSAGNNDGTVYGAQWTTGQIGGALSFDGNGDYVDIADDVALQFTSALTVSAWVYPIDDGGDYYVDAIVVKGENVGWGPKFNYRIAMENSNLYTWGVCKSGGELYFHGGAPAYDTWQHLTLTADGTTCRAYINGIEMASGGALGPYLTFPGYPLQIGGHGVTNARWFSGLIDDVRIYNTALPAEEIHGLYLSGLGNVVDLEIAGPTKVTANSSVSYSATVYFENGSTWEVTDLVNWSIEPDTHASIDVNGVLTVGDIDTGQTITIFADYIQGDETVSAQKIITVVEGPLPIAHYKFDETSGTTALDSSGNSNHGSVHGAAWATGVSGGALNFDGVDDYVDILDGFDNFTNGFTCTLWAYPISVKIHSRFIDFGNGPSADNIIFSRHGTSNSLAFWSFAGSNGSSVMADEAIELNKWQYFAVTLDSSSNATIYKNGEQAAAGTINILNNITRVNNYIGKSNFSGDAYYHGYMDDICIYNQALTEAQILEVMLRPESIVDIEIIGPYEVAENSSAGFKAIAHYDDNSTMDISNFVDWSVDPDAHMSIEPNGVLLTGDIEKFENVTISAQLILGDIIFEDSKIVTVYAICPEGTALQFDGIDDYVEVQPDLILDFGTGDFAVEAWIYPRADSDKAIVSRWQKDNWAWDLRLGWPSGGDGDKLYFFFGSSPGSGIQISETVSLNTWHHVVATRRNDVLYGYLDGVEYNAGTQNGYGSNSNANLNIGHFPGYGTGFFDGTIDEVAIYNRALSAEQIQANMRIQLQGDEPNLVAYWNFDESEGQVVYDLSGNGNNGYLGADPCEVDDRDPTWIESDAPIGFCSPYLIAKISTRQALEHKIASLVELEAALDREAISFDALEDLLESGDFGSLKRNDVIAAKISIQTAIPRQIAAKRSLRKTIQSLEAALERLACEVEPHSWPEEVEEDLLRADINEDGIINMLDIAELASNWLESYE